MRARLGRESGSPDSGPQACVLREQVAFFGDWGQGGEIIIMLLAPVLFCS